MNRPRDRLPFNVIERYWMNLKWWLLGGKIDRGEITEIVNWLNAKLSA